MGSLELFSSLGGFASFFCELAAASSRQVPSGAVVPDLSVRISVGHSGEC